MLSFFDRWNIFCSLAKIRNFLLLEVVTLKMYTLKICLTKIRNLLIYYDDLSTLYTLKAACICFFNIFYVNLWISFQRHMLP